VWNSALTTGEVFVEYDKEIGARQTDPEALQKAG
jgi:hypothetical protein